MSVQRYTNTDNAIMVTHNDGKYVLFTDHERAVAEARQQALLDAVEAVKREQRNYLDHTITKALLADAVAAIEALGGES